MIRAINEMHFEAEDYLREVGYHRSSITHFLGHRYNIMTTNVTESFNALVKQTRFAYQDAS